MFIGWLTCILQTFPPQTIKQTKEITPIGVISLVAIYNLGNSLIILIV